MSEINKESMEQARKICMSIGAHDDSDTCGGCKPIAEALQKCQGEIVDLKEKAKDKERLKMELDERDTVIANLKVTIESLQGQLLITTSNRERNIRGKVNEIENKIETLCEGIQRIKQHTKWRRSEGEVSANEIAIELLGKK